MKRIAVALAVVFAVTAAVIVGNRLTPEAGAVLVGVICGVAAGIPTSILLLAVMQRRDITETRSHLSNWPTYPQNPDNAPHALPGHNHYPPYVISGRDLREQRKEDD